MLSIQLQCKNVPMTEAEIILRPQISLSPDGVLDIVTEFDVDDEMASGQDQIIDELLDGGWGLVNYMVEDDVVGLKVEAERFSSFDFSSSAAESRRLDNFLVKLSHLFPQAPTDNVDRVFGYKHLGRLGPFGSVYPQLQRWLIRGAIDESVARRAIEAMAIPYDDEQRNLVAENFSWSQTYANAADLEIALNLGDRSEFLFSRSVESEDGWRVQPGEVMWNWLRLKTFGECACWGVDGSDRMNLHFDSDQRGLSLYDMKPHNIDAPHKTLSLVLGMAVLSHEAYEYVGQEDVFDNASMSDTLYQPRFFSS